MISASHDDQMLLVEGPTDKAVLLHLLVKYGLAQGVVEPRIQACGTLEKLLANAGVRVTATRRLGLVIDHDEPEDRRWSNLRAMLERQGVALPEAPTPTGTISRGYRDGFVVGVWVMPDNMSPGMLEHFLDTLVPEDQKNCRDYAREATSIAVDRGARFRARHRQKAELYTWLAWQDPPGSPPGHALRGDIFAADSQVARGFVAWYRALFGAADPSG